MMTVTDAAERLGLTPVRVRQFCQQGRLGEKCGSFWIISEAELRRFAKKTRKSGRPWDKKQR